MILTLRFVATFAACWVCFAAVPRRWRPLTLAFWGAVFYAMFAGMFLAVVLALVALTYFSERRTIAWITGGALLTLLYYFKVRAAVFDAGAGALPAGTILVPLGFSYLSFELLHVVVERRRGRIGSLSLPDLLAFAFFAPARVAGPIKRYPDFTAAVSHATISIDNVYAGLARVLVGLAKKLFVADVLALTVAERGEVRSAGHAWIVVMAFTVQIYFDFSAYSDVAIGFSRMLGIVLPENFNLAVRCAEHPRVLEPVAHDAVGVGAGLRVPADRARPVPDAAPDVRRLRLPRSATCSRLSSSARGTGSPRRFCSGASITACSWRRTTPFAPRPRSASPRIASIAPRRPRRAARSSRLCSSRLAGCRS